MVNRKCRVCKTEFEPYVPHHYYCSLPCKSKYFRLKNYKKILEYEKNRRIKNKEKIKEYKHEYYKRNKDLIYKKQRERLKDKKLHKKYLQYLKEYNKKNKEKNKIMQKNYYGNNKEKIAKYHKEWVEKNYDFMIKKRREYYQKNPEKKKRLYQLRHKNLMKNPSKLIFSRLKNRLRKKLNKCWDGKMGSSKEYYGIDLQKVTDFLIEKHYQKDLNLKDYHIHHIKSLCNFKIINDDDSLNIQELQKAFAPENHQLVTIKKHKIIHSPNHL